MKVILTIRNTGAGRVKVSTDMKHESADTPRISNLGLEIKAELDAITDDCAKISTKGE